VQPSVLEISAAKQAKEGLGSETQYKKDLDPNFRKYIEACLSGGDGLAFLDKYFNNPPREGKTSSL